MKVKKLVAGVGVNDADYSVKPRGGVHCPFHIVWSNMINRVYSESYGTKFSAYKGCSVDPRWHSFMNFKAWMEKQDWKNKALDKDVLIEGNRVYSPDTCVFITSELNTFLTDESSGSGDCLLGVYRNVSGSFVAQIGSGKRFKYLGSFETEELAHCAYRKCKYERAVEYARIQTDPRISNALLQRYTV